jgi:ATP-dependent helicase/nuclease subunit A
MIDPPRRATDEHARERATDPQRSILLQAPAGSGKTTVLTQRLLRLLAEVDEPEEILAITFTRKAAAEMRARVLKALRGEIDAGNPQGKRLRALADAALRRAAARGWNLAHDPGRLRIQTIDSFNFRLASQLPVTAKAGGALVITDRPRELYHRAARRTLTAAEDDAELGADVELLFERLDNHWSNVEGLLASMLEQRGHWLRYVLGHEPGALCARIGESLGNIISDHLAVACARLPKAFRAETGFVLGVGPLGSEPECLEAWKSLASLTLTLKGEWRRPKGINKTLGPAYEEAAAKDALRACIERLSGMAGAREVLLELTSLPASTLCETDAAAVEALSRVLRDAAVQLQAEFALAGRVDHTYIGGAARAALTDAGLPTDLALRTGLSLRHILVDEFQDTSLAQFDLIEALTAGWEEGDGRTLFVVGDPMQSIYQFREAEVGLFLKARDHGIGGVRLEPLRLTRNFRSTPALIEWTNDTFTRLFPQNDDLRASAVAFTPSVAAEGEPPESSGSPATGQLRLFSSDDRDLDESVQLHLFPGDDRACETAAITERIKALKEQDPQGSVAVLVASRAHAAPIMAALEGCGIAAIGVDLIPLRELSIVRDLVALIEALHHLGDRTAWLAVLRAPWCGVTLATLTALSQRNDSRLVWEAMADKDRLLRCSESDRARLVRVRDVLEAAFAARDGTPLADWLELTWLRLGAADAYPTEDLRHARAFLSALSDRVAAGEWSGPRDLDSLLGDLYAQPQTSAGNPVQIMTIHRAKGLEFDHVFVPSLDRDLNRGREPLLRWLDLPRSEGKSDLIMAPVPAIGDDAGGDVSAYLKRLMSKRASNEQTRLLYVAATRSKRTLYLSAAPKTRPDGTVAPRVGTLLARWWPALGSRFSTPTDTTAAAITVREAIAASSHSLHRLVADWVPPTLDAAPDLPRLPIAHQSLEPPEFSWVGETARHIGTVVHAGLEAFASARDLPTRSWIEAHRDAYLYQLRRHGVPERELPRAAALVVEALTRTIADDRGRWIFAAEHRDARSELALTGIAAGRLTNVVIDRSFVDRDGTRWVIDFKTSRHEGGGLEGFLDQEMQRYRAQLETYVALARALGPNPVRAGLYFPLLGAFREV